MIKQLPKTYKTGKTLDGNLYPKTTSWKSKIKYSIKTDPKSQNIMKVTETNMQGIKTTVSINTEIIFNMQTDNNNIYT